jgi:hypothetical protein
VTFNLPEILRSKREMRQRLAARPVGEKLRLLDELRERALAIAASRSRGAAPSRPSIGTTPQTPGGN